MESMTIVLPVVLSLLTNVPLVQVDPAQGRSESIALEGIAEEETLVTEENGMMETSVEMGGLSIAEEPAVMPVEEKPAPIADPVPIPPQPEQNNPAVGEFDRKSWWFKRNQDNLPPSAQQDIAISQYDAYYLGDTQKKVIYLTFDEGYENGYTEQILDILKENDVKAAFFVTKTYIEDSPELVKRMAAEGHIVGNHSVTHGDFSKMEDVQILAELDGCAQAFYELTGQEMPKFFRPPEGVYSIHALEQIQQAGYKTIFWSYAYEDWNVNKQPGKEAAFQMMKNNYHNGGIYLLHAVSQSNTEALGDIIAFLKEEGYTFLTLSDLP